MSGRKAISAGLLRIWRQTAEAGEALPSEESLAQELGSSRLAVREALIQMEAHGLVRRHHGSGTYPNPAALGIPVRFDEQRDFADRLAAVGFEARVEVVDASVLSGDEIDPPTRLELDAEVRVLRTVKRWWADDVIAVVAVDTLPLSRAIADADAIARAEESVLTLASGIGIGRADWTCVWPSAVELDAPTAELLAYETGRAVLRTEQIGVDRHGRTVFHALEHHRPNLVDHGMIRTVYG